MDPLIKIMEDRMREQDEIKKLQQKDRRIGGQEDSPAVQKSTCKINTVFKSEKDRRTTAQEDIMT